MSELVLGVVVLALVNARVSVGDSVGVSVCVARTVAVGLMQSSLPCSDFLPTLCCVARPPGKLHRAATAVSTESVLQDPGP